jgi:hypothetical protein
MLLKYIGPKAQETLDPRWGSFPDGRQYSFTPPSMTCEVAEEHAKVLLAECAGLFIKAEVNDSVRVVEKTEPPKRMDRPDRPPWKEKKHGY